MVEDEVDVKFEVLQVVEVSEVDVGNKDMVGEVGEVELGEDEVSEVDKV